MSPHLLATIQSECWLAFQTDSGRRGLASELMGTSRWQDNVLKYREIFPQPHSCLSRQLFVPDSDLLIPGVGINPTRSAVLAILRLMGADIEISSERLESNEPVCDLRVRSASLTGIDIPADFVANAIDEFPVLAIAAAAASGVTRVRGANGTARQGI